MFNLLNEHLSFARVEGDASTRSTSSSRTATSVDVGLCLFGWLNLNDQVDVGDVEAS